MTYGVYFFLSLLFTLAVEIPISTLLFRYLFRIQAPTRELMFWDTLANLFSFPYLWFVFPLIIRTPYYLPVGEALVVLIEAIILARGLRTPIKKTLAVSFIANLASYCIGKIIF